MTYTLNLVGFREDRAEAFNNTSRMR